MDWLSYAGISYVPVLLEELGPCAYSSTIVTLIEKKAVCSPYLLWKVQRKHFAGYFIRGWCSRKNLAFS